MTLQWIASKSLRLIDLLKNHLDPSISNRLIKRSLESNSCRVNGQIERFGSVLLKKGDRIEWNLSNDSPNSTLQALHEEEDWIAIDKPSGVICTDGYFQKVLKKKVYLAHRLDKDTTGVLLLGKSYAAAQELQKLFQQRTVEKRYLAIVAGNVLKEQGKIESYLYKKSSFHGQTIWGSRLQGKGLFASTFWKRISVSSHASLIQCFPQTGRTHQIRVHLAELGHPILIDRQYGKVFKTSIFIRRPLLHADRLCFTFRGQLFDIAAALPFDFCDALKQLGLFS